MSSQQYIGARYVVKIYENKTDPSKADWDANTTYEPLTMVTFEYNSYLSKKLVPATVGNPAANPEYWVQTGYYSGQVMELYNKVAILNDELSHETSLRIESDDDLQHKISNLGIKDNEIEEEISSTNSRLTLVNNALTSEVNNRINAVNAEKNARIAADNDLSDRIDSIVAPSGEAPSVAEILDARYGANGVTYDSLGAAIRAQITSTNESIEMNKIPTPFYSGTTSISDVDITDNGGTITLDGTSNTLAIYWLSDYNSYDKALILEDEQVYCISGGTANAELQVVSIDSEGNRSGAIATDEGYGARFVADSAYRYLVRLYIPANSAFSDVTIKPMLNVGYIIKEFTQPSKPNSVTFDNALLAIDNSTIADDNYDVLSVDYLPFKVFGYIDDTSKKWTQALSHEYYSALVPIKGGDKISITANSNYGASIAFLKSNAMPVNNADADLSDTYNSVMFINTKTERYYITPNDSHYLYVRILTSINSKPSSIKINGYDIIENINNHIVKLENTHSLAFNIFDKNYLANGAYASATGEVVNVGSSHYMMYQKDLDDSVVWIGTALYDLVPVLCAWDNNNNWVGIYDKDSNSFITRWFSSVKYNYVDLEDVRSSYPNYRYRFYIWSANGSIIPYLDKITIQNKYAEKSKHEKVRVMQYNIGKFSYGTPTPELTEEQYAEKLPNYKAVLCEYKPDIIAMQEFTQYMDANSQHDSDSVLFDYLYPYKNTNYQSASKSVYPLIGFQREGIIYSTSYPSMLAVYSKAYYRVGNKRVCILSLALPYFATANGLTARSEILAQAINMADGEEYAFICSDLNNNGNGDDVTPIAEGELMKTQIETAGWGLINGNYLGWLATCVSNSDWTTLQYIDNILYKNNGLTSVQNVQSLRNEFEELSSDHFPLIGDFVI